MTDSPKSHASCLTCRQKGRRCDRTQPGCLRCRSRGLVCRGYLPKFKFCGVASRGKLKDALNPEPRPQHIAPSPPKRAPELVESSLPSHPPADGRLITSPLEAVLSPSSLVSTSSKGVSPGDAWTAELERLLISSWTEKALSYYDSHICPHIMVNDPSLCTNPYRSFILPLAYEHLPLLHAILALTACHMSASGFDGSDHETEALSHRTDAMRLLRSTLGSENRFALQSLNDWAQDAILATILILLIHDICDSGVSVHGAHLTGASTVYQEMMNNMQLGRHRPRTLFLLSTLSWFDLVRCFSGSQKLSFSQETRQLLAQTSDCKFEMMNGCPREIFLIMGDVFARAKDSGSSGHSFELFKYYLYKRETELRLWDETRYVPPTPDPLWIHVANAFRYACLLRIFQFRRDFLPVDREEVEDCNCKLLDSVSKIPIQAELAIVLVLPLTMVGAECTSPHARHYILLRLNALEARINFRNCVAFDLLHRIWAARDADPKVFGSTLAWTDFTHNKELEYQHDYLIF